jgi:hypothetical protein
VELVSRLGVVRNSARITEDVGAGWLPALALLVGTGVIPIHNASGTRPSRGRIPPSVSVKA